MTKFITVTSFQNGRKFLLPINNYFHCYEPIDETMKGKYGNCFIEYMQCVGSVALSETLIKAGTVFYVKESFETVQLLIQQSNQENPYRTK